MCVCVRACVCACVCVNACVRARAFRVCVCAHARARLRRCDAACSGHTGRVETHTHTHDARKHHRRPRARARAHTHTHTHHREREILKTGKTTIHTFTRFHCNSVKSPKTVHMWQEVPLGQRGSIISPPVPFPQSEHLYLCVYIYKVNTAAFPTSLFHPKPHECANTTWGLFPSFSYCKWTVFLLNTTVCAYYIYVCFCVASSL